MVVDMKIIVKNYVELKKSILNEFLTEISEVLYSSESLTGFKLYNKTWHFYSHGEVISLKEVHSMLSTAMSSRLIEAFGFFHYWNRKISLKNSSFEIVYSKNHQTYERRIFKL